MFFLIWQIMALTFSSNRFLREFSTFGIGGPISYFAEVSTFEEMKEGIVFAHIHNLPFLVLGKGSNSLFDDRGFKGVVLLNKIDFCSWSENFVCCGSGYSFSLLGVQAAKKNMEGLEFACGIPATVGGAIFMNAGANGKETQDCLYSVSYLDEDLQIKEVKKQDLEFGYRYSIFQKNKFVILSAKFQLIKAKDSIRHKQLSILDYRLKTQPYKDKSIGCIFRNPEKQIPAGRLIEECGLKGISVGGAQVSLVHANFIINAGNATQQQVLQLIAVVQEKVFAKTQILLEPEIKVINYE